MGFLSKSVSLTLLALFFFTSSVFTTAPGSAPLQLAPPLSKVPPLPRWPPMSVPPLPKAPPMSVPPLPRWPPMSVPPLPRAPPMSVPPLPRAPPMSVPPLPRAPPMSVPPLPPSKLPSLPSLVRGMVYCKACKYAGVDTLIGAKPVKDATVRLLCKNQKKPIETKTDQNGYFMFLAPKNSIKYCKAFLVKSPNAKCSTVTNLHDGKLGSVLKPVPKPEKSTVIFNKIMYALFNVGPFAFNPTTCPK